MSANPLRTLVLILVVAGYGTLTVGGTQLNGVVARAAATFIASHTGSAVPDEVHAPANAPYGMWSFEFE